MGRQRAREARWGSSYLLLAFRRRDILHASCICQEQAGGFDIGASTCFEAFGQRGIQMRKQDFDKLVESIKQAGKIRRGEMKASRTFNFEPADIKSIRGQLKMSQSEFALMIGVSLSTLQNWEQGRRRPEGPARALLKVVAENPRAVVKALSA